MTDNPASILEDERIYSGFLAPSYMPEGGYDVIAGVSGWPRPVRGYIGAGGVGGPPDGQSSVDYPGEYVPDFPDYGEPVELGPDNSSGAATEPRYLLRVLGNVPENITYGQIPGTYNYGIYPEYSLDDYQWYNKSLDQNLENGGFLFYQGLFPELTMEELFALPELQGLLARTGDERDIYNVTTSPNTTDLTWPGMESWLADQPEEISKYLGPENWSSAYETRYGFRYPDEATYTYPELFQYDFREVTDPRYYDWPLGEIPIEVGDVEPMSDTIFDIVGGGLIDAGPVTETPYG